MRRCTRRRTHPREHSRTRTGSVLPLMVLFVALASGLWGTAFGWSFWPCAIAATVIGALAGWLLADDYKARRRLG